MHPDGRSAGAAWAEGAEPTAPSGDQWSRVGVGAAEAVRGGGRQGVVKGPRLRVDGRDAGRARPARLC
jgi:hypothetical protein